MFNCGKCVFFTSYEDICEDILEPADVGECFNPKSVYHQKMVTDEKLCLHFRSRKTIETNTDK